jgi:hypothetical protein
MRRSIRVIVGFGVLVAVLWTGLPTLSSYSADAERTTYRLTDFDITYPYDDPRSDVSPSFQSAGVSYMVHWPGGRYPGNAHCHLKLVAAGGQAVGSLAFHLDSASDGVRTRLTGVPVDRPPASAEAACAPGEPYLPGAGYLFEGPTKISSPVDNLTGEAISTWTELTFQVSWEHPGRFPGFRTCELFVSRMDGREDPPITIGMHIHEGPETLNIKGPPATVRDARVTCRPLGT